ncbi:uncharacterized protein N7477_005540 [Penicillium maclennaniae]|uniref:uncharacterized protein n=1 Tax=Penicillium maclennaniae TaxID=1343394 RepID=UPI0025401E65|nr:uncharacterized protein N7477_005540 [Penicillium maclennaniae]KAJ5670177.1 hypothetical protein N7477_005540 [Penicillium maclennaniae]
MDVLTPPECPPLTPSEYPRIPTRTPLATLERIRKIFISGDIKKFRDDLDAISSTEGNFDICDFHAIMVEAITRDDAQFTKELLDRGLPPDTLYVSQAVRVKAKHALGVFISSGWDINQPMSELKPPVLGDAIADEEMAAWLLDHGADPNRRCLIDLTPPSLAVESAPISVISLMFSRGGDVGKGRLLHHAIERQSDTIEVLKILIEKGASLDSTAYEDHPSWALFHFMGLGTALHKAAELGKVDVVSYLVSEGASQCVKDANGRTATDCARMLNQWQVVEILDKEK